jgi:hypothetical protein
VRSVPTPADVPGDSKDWTWVLEHPCPECGYDPASVDPRTIPAMVRANVATWLQVLARPDVRARPRPDVWSPLEYACHVRDVYRVFDARLHLMLEEDDPQFTNWDQDETAVRNRYREQDPTDVSAELAAAGATVASSFADVSDDEWSRRGTRSDGAVFTVESFGRYFVHDWVHHAWDVGAS